MRKYTFELVVFEGNDEFWEGHPEYTGSNLKEPRGYATAEEVENLVRYELDCFLSDYKLILRKYENDESIDI